MPRPTVARALQLGLVGRLGESGANGALERRGRRGGQVPRNHLPIAAHEELRRRGGA